MSIIYCKTPRPRLYVTWNGQTYYKVIVRKYYHFDPMTLVKANYEPCYIGSIYAPIFESDVQLQTVDIEAKTFALEHHFSVPASKCPEGIEEYLKTNLNRFATSTVWYESNKEVTDMYLHHLKLIHNIEVDISTLTYSNQYCWEIECE